VHFDLTERGEIETLRGWELERMLDTAMAGAAAAEDR
jgi:hypothetical protein